MKSLSEQLQEILASLVFVAESPEMVSLLLSIGKGLWAFLVLGLGLLSVFLLVLFLGGFLVDLVKDIIERIKKK
jgi:hypothetical protein